MSKVTAATVNKELKRLGFLERLYHGNGYFYFADGDACFWYDTMVNVNHAHDLTLDQWLFEYNRCKTSTGKV